MPGLWDVFLLLEWTFSRHVYALLSVSHHAANKVTFEDIYIYIYNVLVGIYIYIYTNKYVITDTCCGVPDTFKQK